MAKSKATKKFEKNKLKGVLDKRKENRKVKHQHQSIEKKKQSRTRKKAQLEENEALRKLKKGGEKSDVDIEAPKAKLFADMSIDDFFAGGFDVANELVEKKATPPQHEANAGADTHSRKRKRGEDVELDSDDEDELGFSAAEENLELEDFHSGDNDLGGGDDEASIDMKALAVKDPDFFKYLQENDKDLLEFDAEGGDLALSDDEEQDEQPSSKKPAKKKAKQKPQDEDLSDAPAFDADQPVKGPAAITTIDDAILKKWTIALTVQHSIRTLQHAILAFRASMPSSADKEAAAEPKSKRGRKDISKFEVQSAETYDALLQLVLKQAPKILDHHLPVQTNPATGKMRIDQSNKKFLNLVPVLRTYASSLLRLLPELEDEATQKLILNALTQLLPYILSFKTLLRDLVRTVTTLWSTPATTSSTSITESARITAFLLLRTLHIHSDPSTREALLKAVYKGILSAGRTTSPHTLVTQNLLKNSAVELWGLDAKASYITSFTAIRQLALHLRTAIQKPGPGSNKVVYNWQFVHALDFWSRMLSTHCVDAARLAVLAPSKRGHEAAAKQLAQLIYPLVQITTGLLNLNSTSAQYFPTHLHLLRSLLRLSRTTGTFIPLFPSLLAILNSNELRKPPKASTGRPLDFRVVVRAPTSYLKTRVYAQGLGEEVLELLGEGMEAWGRSISFPELALPVCVALRRWLKRVAKGSKGGSGNKMGKLNTQVHSLVLKLEEQCVYIRNARDKVDFGPTDRVKCEKFLEETETEGMPLGAWIKVQRVVRDEKAKLAKDGDGGDGGREDRPERESNGHKPKKRGKRRNDESDDDEDSPGSEDIEMD